jgi:hypothetical protein
MGFDPADGALYVTGTALDAPGGQVVRWNSRTSTRADLTPKFEAVWGVGVADDHDAYALAVDAPHSTVYVGGKLARLARYRTPQHPTQPDTASLVALSLTAWGHEDVFALQVDPAGFVWIGGGGGKVLRLNAR